jgi:hypothetical protein
MVSRDSVREDTRADELLGAVIYFGRWKDSNCGGVGREDVGSCGEEVEEAENYR